VVFAAALLFAVILFLAVADCFGCADDCWAGGYCCEDSEDHFCEGGWVDGWCEVRKLAKCWLSRAFSPWARHWRFFASFLPAAIPLRKSPNRQMRRIDDQSVDAQESEMLQNKLSFIDVAKLSLFTSDGNANTNRLQLWHSNYRIILITLCTDIASCE
jgi:hypothetical protein